MSASLIVIYIQALCIGIFVFSIWLDSRNTEKQNMCLIGYIMSMDSNKDNYTYWSNHVEEWLVEQKDYWDQHCWPGLDE